jgi:hypothetical protein
MASQATNPMMAFGIIPKCVSTKGDQQERQTPKKVEGKRNPSVDIRRAEVSTVK